MFEAEGRALGWGRLDEYNLLDEDDPIVTI